MQTNRTHVRTNRAPNAIPPNILHRNVQISFFFEYEFTGICKFFGRKAVTLNSEEMKKKKTLLVNLLTIFCCCFCNLREKNETSGAFQLISMQMLANNMSDLMF